MSNSATPWTVALQAHLSMGFPTPEYCSGLQFSSLGDLPNPTIKTRSSALQADSFFFFFFSFIFISWRLTTSQYRSGSCHTLTWISPGFTCIPHPDPISHLPLYPVPLGLPSAPGLSTCRQILYRLSHQGWYVIYTNPKLPVHPSLSPPTHWQSQVCSLCLSGCFCFADRFICAIV